MSSTSPVRAIRSSLSARPQPSVPPSQKAYVPLAKHILQQRLVRHIFIYTGLTCWIQAFIWTVWLLGGLEQLGSSTFVAPFYPYTLLLAGTMWMVAALPAIVIRKAYLTTKPTLAASPSALVKSALSKQSTSRSTLTYVLSSILLLVLLVVFEGDPKLRLFVKSKKHPLYLNPRLIYLIFSQIVAALVYTFRNVLLDRFVFHFSPPSSPQRLISAFTVLHAVVICTIITTLSTPLACIAFGLSRLFLPLLYRLPLLPYLLKPFTAHFLRGTWTLILPLHQFPLLFRGWFIAFTTLLTWEFSSLLFESSTSQPITISHLTADPNMVLISGISASTSPFPLHYFAFLELRNIASSQNPQSATLRSSLFSDQKYSPSLWSHLVRQSLLLLGHDYQTLTRRGQPPPTPASPTPPADPTQTHPGKAAAPFPSTPIKFIPNSSSAFKPFTIPGPGQRPSSPGNAVAQFLASDGPLARAVDEGTDDVEDAVAKVPELFRSVLRERRSPPQQRPSSVATGTGTGLKRVEPSSSSSFSSHSGWSADPKKWWDDALNGIKGRVKTWVVEWDGCPVWFKNGVRAAYDWWTVERVHKVVENGVPNKELDLVVFDMLSHYVCASLTEDQYGVVQRDIPRILEAMVRFLGEVDKWRAEISAGSSLAVTATIDESSPSAIADSPQRPKPKTNQEQRAEEERLKANAVLTELSDGLKESIGRIVRTFGDKLMAFRFPPAVASGVQAFMDYC